MTQNKTINIGAHSAQFTDLNVKGEQITIDGESFYKISNVNGMRSFFYEHCKPFKPLDVYF